MFNDARFADTAPRWNFSCSYYEYQKSCYKFPDFRWKTCAANDAVQDSRTRTPVVEPLLRTSVQDDRCVATSKGARSSKSSEHIPTENVTSKLQGCLGKKLIF